ncbi:MarR family winged helix-turn-helix transcriptional regulator [Devosia sp.]|uniref:MarR family winged helix-turn-helix transcriptional regulator n=1 Tax=Devosia sp. TaxID=1871048 RepID=UPI00345BCD5A
MNLKALPGHLARRFHQISNALFDQEMREAGLPLTPIQYAALVAIRDNPEIDQVTLAGLIAYDRTTISGVIDRLAEKGLIARVASSIDRRAKLLTLLDEGSSVLAVADPVVQRSQERLVQCLAPSEVDQLNALLGKVVDSMGNVSRTGR